MTRRISFIVATASAALVVAAPAFGDNSTSARQGPGSLAVSPAVFKSTVSAANPSSERLGPGNLAISPEVYESTVLGLSDELTTMLDARREALGRSYQLGDFAVNNTWQAGGSGASIYGDASDRAAVASGGKVFADAHQRGTVPSTTTESPYLKGLAAYGAALNRQYEVGQGATPVGDSHERVDFGNPPVSSPTVSSGSEIDWPEAGIGFGVGMIILLGLILTVRVGRNRPLAH